MRKIFYALALATGVFIVTPVYAEETKQPEIKKVCVMQKDAKTGKEKEVCKQVKIHKKLDGTKVPDKK